jgi:signal transduction histidine kinase
MTAIKGFLDLIATQPLDEQTKERYYKIINDEIERMSGMISDILDYSRGDIRLNVKKANVKDFMNRIKILYERIMKSRGIQFELKPKYKGEIEMDEEKMRRVADNLLKNAMEACASGDTITLSTGKVDGRVFFSVEDTGSGIPEEVVDKIFEPFASYGEGHGTGLGLAVSKKIVEQHGGEIEVSSKPGKGSKFTVWLPVLQ